MLALLLLSMMPGVQPASLAVPASTYTSASPETPPSATLAPQSDAPLGRTASSGIPPWPAGRLERVIGDAHAAAHRPSAEDVTTAMDGTDKIYRIRTPYGANVCLNWRDADRFNPGKRKTVFVTACNR